MKLRFSESKIILRLDKNDRKKLNQEGRCDVVIKWGQQHFSYTLLVVEESELDLKMADNKVTVYIPRGEFATWNESDRIGLNRKVDNCQLIIEKDLKTS